MSTNVIHIQINVYLIKIGSLLNGYLRFVGRCVVVQIKHLKNVGAFLTYTHHLASAGQTN